MPRALMRTPGQVRQLIDPVALFDDFRVDLDVEEFRSGTSCHGTSVRAEMIFGFSFDPFTFRIRATRRDAANAPRAISTRKFHIFTLFFSSAMLTSWQTQLISPCISTYK